MQGKQGTPHYKIKQMEQRPASEWVRVPDAHEALIARQDFELVQRIKGLDTRTSPNEDTVYLFSGILICGCCGSRMTRKTNRANGKEYHYYYCPTGKKKGCAHPVMLKESSLIDCVRDSLKAYIGKDVYKRQEIFRTDCLYTTRAENPRGLERVASKCLGCGNPASSEGG